MVPGQSISHLCSLFSTWCPIVTWFNHGVDIYLPWYPASKTSVQAGGKNEKIVAGAILSYRQGSMAGGESLSGGSNG